MNEFDQFVKHKLKIKHYVRYTDDFVVISDDIKYLGNLIPKVNSFLDENLKLKLHPHKISIRKFRQGIDFLGYVVLPHYRLLRNKTKRRIVKKLQIRVMEYKEGKITENTLGQSLNSYLGVLSHANMHNFREELRNLYWFWLSD